MEHTNAQPNASDLPEKVLQVPAHDLKPWEQHASVISIPRFDYKAPTSILETPHSGFLITCPIKREKSATKEAISILEKYLEHGNGNSGDEGSESCELQDSKKRKTCSESERGPMSNNGSDCGISTSCGNPPKRVNLSLVKLRRNGLLLFTIPGNCCNNPVSVLSRILQSLESGDLKQPQWCHRIFPIQETCALKVENLHAVVSKLVRAYINDAKRKSEKPIKFAVGYNRRGLDETDKKLAKSSGNAMDLLARDECFKVVAKAVKDIAEDAIVDLNCPELIVLIELLPISGIVNGPPVAGVSILPADMASTKPRLSVKALDNQLRKAKG